MTEFADLIEPVARRLFGNPSDETANELRFGSRGSLKINRAGPHKGTFSDFESGSGGGVLDLIVHHQGGDRKAAIEWLRREFGDVAGKPEQAGTKRPVAVYAYCDENGRPLFEVVRYEPKDFRQRKPDGSWGVKGVRLVPYRLPEVREAIS